MKLKQLESVGFVREIQRAQGHRLDVPIFKFAADSLVRCLTGSTYTTARIDPTNMLDIDRTPFAQGEFTLKEMVLNTRRYPQDYPDVEERWMNLVTEPDEDGKIGNNFLSIPRAEQDIAYPVVILNGQLDMVELILDSELSQGSTVSIEALFAFDLARVLMYEGFWAARAVHLNAAVETSVTRDISVDAPLITSEGHLCAVLGLKGLTGFARIDIDNAQFEEHSTSIRDVDADW